MPKSGRTVLVLGGGVGGVVAARRLRQRLGDGDRVVLIDREPNHLFQSSLLWLLVGQRRPDQIQRPLANLERNGIELVTGAITDLDAERRRVMIGDSELRGDAMIVSLGAEFAPEIVPGLTEAGHNVYGLTGTMSFRDALQRYRGGRVAVVTAAPAYKCPAAPHLNRSGAPARRPRLPEGSSPSASVALSSAISGTFSIAIDRSSSPPTVPHPRRLLTLSSRCAPTCALAECLVAEVTTSTDSPVGTSCHVGLLDNQRFPPIACWERIGCPLSPCFALPQGRDGNPDGPGRTSRATARLFPRR